LAALALSAILALLAPAGAQAAAGPIDLISTGPGGGNGDADACDVSILCLDFEASADGTRAFFSTTERLAPSDQDTSKDVYERSGATTSQVSTGTTGGNGNFDVTLQAISEDGAHAFFGTYEALTRDDLDLTSDVFERSSEVRLVSTGAASSNLQLDVCSAGSPSALACFGLASAAGGIPVFFTTPESLTFDDLDVGCFSAPARCDDVYQRSGDKTTLVSTGTGGASGATLIGLSRDGTRVFFTTKAALTSTDTDQALDIYERSGGSIKLVSTGPLASSSGPDVVNDLRVSSDGSHAVFATAEPLVAADADTAVDIYERAGGATTLVSATPGKGNGPRDACDRYDGCPGLALSADGAHVFFETADSLVAADTDSAVDVYERVGGVTNLVSEGTAGQSGGEAGASLEGISAGGTHAFFATAGRLVAADTDAAVDVYERAGGVTALVSVGTQGGGGADATLQQVSAGGSRAFFSTGEQLVAEDTDQAADVYVRAGGSTALVSGGSTNQDAFFLDMSDDGKRVFFATPERLVPADTDARIDVYAADLSALPGPPEDPPPPPPPPPPGDDDGGNGGGAGQGGAPTGSPPAGAGVRAPDNVAAASSLQADFSKSLRASASGMLRLRIRCAGGTACSGRVMVKAGAPTIARKSFKIAAGHVTAVPVKLSSKGRRRLARAKGLKATVVVQTLGASGALSSSTLKVVTVRAAKQRRTRTSGSGELLQ
jgi:hypothetical protein